MIKSLREGSSARVAFIWHATSANNLGLSALTSTSLVMADKALRRRGLRMEADLMVTGLAEPNRLDVTTVSPNIRPIAVHGNGSLAGRSLANLAKRLRTYDAVIDVSSGDSFTSIYGRRGNNRQLITKYAALASGTRLILAPQTIGPFSSRDHLLALPVLRGARHVFCRDSVSAAMVNRIPGARASAVPDLAFALNPVGNPDSSVSRTKTVVGFNVSGLLYHAESSDDYHVPGYRELVVGVLEVLTGRPDIAVVLFPHVVELEPAAPTGTDEDYAVAELLSTRYDVVLPPRFRTAGEAKGWARHFDVLIAGRMHAAIAAASSGVPVIATSYSRKFKDTFATVGYEPRSLQWPGCRPRLEAQVLGLVDQIQLLRDEVAAVADEGERGLAGYVDQLAEVIA